MRHSNKIHQRFSGRQWAVTIIVLAGLLAGCAQTNFLQPQEPVTIRFLVDSGSNAYMTNLLQTFNKKHPNITVEFVNWRMGPGGGAMEESDVLAISQYQYDFLQEQDLIRDLNTLIAEDEKFDLNDFYPSTVNAFSSEGQRWAIPLGANTLVMFYNKDLFDRSNTPYPTVGWTWDDFQNRAISVSQVGGGTFGYAYHMMGNLGFLEPMTFVYQNGGQLFDNLQAPTRVTFNTPQTVEALAWYGRLISAYHVAPGPGERAMPYPETGIENNQFGMWMGWFSDERRENWSIAPLPRGKANGSAMANVVGLVINKDAQNTEACWEWVKFLSEQPMPGLIPARRSLAESAEYEALVGADVAATGRASIEDMLMMRFNLEGQLYQTWGKAMGALTSALTAIRDGEDAQTVLDAAQKQAGF
ncbi:MAG TPA: sugar ABC transporter substrate-binding protein [Anaerolineae bacterium]|nr:sugar ABC transporter substrate-binding protein [Anaerolineae bacterium]HQI85674.1 sugar ABC transporter substrate-binding protein [Anaerolineae bacterium]